MRKSHQWAGLKGLVLALGLVASTAGSGLADTIISYDTSGSIDSSGVSGPGVISFNSVMNGSFNSPSSLSLGDFQVAALPSGQSTTYKDTPFHITLLVNTVNGAAPSPNETPIQVTGVLNGTVTGGDQSDVVAKFDPITTPKFRTGNYLNTIGILDNPLSLVPNSTNHGQTSAQAHLDTVLAPPIPEPTSIAMFLTTLAGFGVRHRLRSRRAA